MCLASWAGFLPCSGLCASIVWVSNVFAQAGAYICVSSALPLMLLCFPVQRGFGRWWRERWFQDPKVMFNLKRTPLCCYIQERNQHSVWVCGTLPVFWNTFTNIVYKILNLNNCCTVYSLSLQNCQAIVILRPAFGDYVNHHTCTWHLRKLQ